MPRIKNILIIVNRRVWKIKQPSVFIGAIGQIAALPKVNHGKKAARTRYVPLTRPVIGSAPMRFRRGLNRYKSGPAMSLHLEQVHWMSSPPLVPDDPPIDLQHLGRMTLGEPGLEREVLSLFATQSHDLMVRLAALPDDAAVLAHTLKGSARAIGAFRVAEAALHFEGALREENDLTGALDALRDAVDEARTAIDAMLRRS